MLQWRPPVALKSFLAASRVPGGPTEVRTAREPKRELSSDTGDDSQRRLFQIQSTRSVSYPLSLYQLGLSPWLGNGVDECLKGALNPHPPICSPTLSFNSQQHTEDITMKRDNLSIVLAERPTGDVIPGQTFHQKRTPLPSPADLKNGEILVENLYLSLDPAMRGWMQGPSPKLTTLRSHFTTEA